MQEYGLTSISQDVNSTSENEIIITLENGYIQKGKDSHIGRIVLNNFEFEWKDNVWHVKDPQDNLKTYPSGTVLHLPGVPRPKYQTMTIRNGKVTFS